MTSFLIQYDWCTGGLVVMDLGVSQAAVVVEHDVDEGVSHQRVAAAGPAAIGDAVGLAHGASRRP